MNTPKLFSAVILSIAFGLLMFAMAEIDNPKPINKEKVAYEDSIAKLNNQIDSLNRELFVTETQITRYEVTLELLKEDNKKAAEKFELIYTTQTE
jgi:septal ring factor EnvC (AmiA/AmiB activator)